MPYESVAQYQARYAARMEKNQELARLLGWELRDHMYQGEAHEMWHLPDGNRLAPQFLPDWHGDLLAIVSLMQDIAKDETFPEQVASLFGQTYSTNYLISQDAETMAGIIATDFAGVLHKNLPKLKDWNYKKYIEPDPWA